MINGNKEENHKLKTRDLSLYDYLEALQVEYVVSNIRKKIYPNKKDKDFYTYVMDNKRKKIEDISSRNSLPTIFNDKVIEDQINNQVLGSYYPNFFYKNQEAKNEFEWQDFTNYYMIDSEFRVNIDGEIKVGTLISISFDQKPEIVKIKLRGESSPRAFLTTQIKRIL